MSSQSVLSRMGSEDLFLSKLSGGEIGETFEKNVISNLNGLR